MLRYRWFKNIKYIEIKKSKIEPKGGLDNFTEINYSINL